jgi:serine/threonine protein kinase
MARGNPHIVQLYDHKITPLPHGGFEILLLLEHCSEGSVVDLMNRKKSFNEPEIIRIFSAICQAVAWLHRNGIIHRDLKVENVLHNGEQFKLCDFGSATKQVIPKGLTLSIEQIRSLTDDINKYTTFAYRAPEICDLYHTRGITSKIDIWALGIFLYKLCFFTTPFEESGKLAILSGKYTIPSTPVYSKNLLVLIRKF